MSNDTRSLRIRFRFFRRCYRLALAFEGFGDQCEFNARDARRFAAVFSGGGEAERRGVKG